MPCNQVDIVQKKTFNSHKLTKNYAMALIRILVGDLNSHLQNQLEKNGQFNLELISDSELLSLLMAKLLMLTQTTYGQFLFLINYLFYLLFLNNYYFINKI